MLDFDLPIHIHFLLKTTVYVGLWFALSEFVISDGGRAKYAPSLHKCVIDHYNSYSQNYDLGFYTNYVFCAALTV